MNAWKRRLERLEAARPSAEPDIFAVGTDDEAADLASEWTARGLSPGTILVTGIPGQPLQSGRWADLLPLIAEHGNSIHGSAL